VNTPVKRQHVLVSERVVERQHRHFVGDDAKSSDGLTGHTLSRGVRGDEVRVLSFERAQLDHQLVVLAVRQVRIVENVNTGSRRVRYVAAVRQLAFRRRASRLRLCPQSIAEGLNAHWS